LSLVVLSMTASMNNGNTMPLLHGGFGCKYTFWM
jgi:nitrogenase molybdenum-iron protein alpha/beta subunit